MIINVELHWQGATGSAAGGETREVREYTAIYWAYSNNAGDTAKTVLDHFKNDPDLPFVDDPFSYGNDSEVDALCDRLDARRTAKSTTQWQVVVTYSTIELGRESKQPDADGNPTSDPLKWIPKLEQGHRSEQRDVWKARYISGIDKWAGELPGKTPCNSAFVPFDPPQQKTVNIPVIRITRYFTGFNSASARVIIDTTNILAFTILKFGFFITVPKRGALVTAVDAAIQRINGGLFFEVRLEFERDDQVTEIVDRGLEERRMAGDPDGLGGTLYNPPPAAVDLERIKDIHNDPVSTPVLFDGSGQKLAPQDGDPHFLKWLVPEESQWELSPFFEGIITGT